MTNTVNEPTEAQQELPFVGVENDEDILCRVTIIRPGVNRECIWGEPMRRNLFRLTQPPILHPDVFLDDVVEALPMEDEPHPVFTRVVRPSGNRSIALLTESAWSSSAMAPVIAAIRASDVDLSLFTDALAVATIPQHVDWDAVAKRLRDSKAPLEAAPISASLVNYVMKPCKCGRCADPIDMVLYHP